MLKQKAVYWAPTGTDRFGKKSYATGIEIKCRWEDVTEQFLDQQGQMVISKAKVYVDRDVVIFGFLWLGTLAEATSTTDPLKNKGAREIQAFAKLPNLKAREFLRTAML